MANENEVRPALGPEKTKESGENVRLCLSRVVESRGLGGLTVSDQVDQIDRPFQFQARGNIVPRIKRIAQPVQGDQRPRA